MADGAQSHFQPVTEFTSAVEKVYLHALPRPYDSCKALLVGPTIAAGDQSSNQGKVDAFERRGLPVALSNDELFAIVAYTGNGIYRRLNDELRLRDPPSRQAAMQKWGGFLWYLLSALGKLPAFQGDVYRGVKVLKDEVLKEYSRTKIIRWAGFSSTSTSFGTAKGFSKAGEIIFKITVQTGRLIQPYSFYQTEDEVLLSPNSELLVISDPYQVDGYTIIDMIEIDAENAYDA